MRERESRPRFEPGSLGKLFDRLPPHSLEAEMALLGSLILGPEMVGEVLGHVSKREQFHLESHGAIFEAILRLYDKHQTGDLVQLLDALRDSGVLEQIGGEDYLVQLVDTVPSAANARHYARIVADKAKLRKLIGAAGEIIYDAYNAPDNPDEGVREILDKAEMSVFDIAQEEQTSEPQALKDLLSAEVERLEATEGQGISGLPTGFGDLDSKLRGLQKGEMLIIAARPSMGKCLTEESEITLSDGSVRTIAELCRTRSGELATLNEHLRLEWATPSDFVDDGMKPAFEVTTRLGRRVRTTLPHPFLTVHGWKPLSELSVGDHVGVPRELPAFGRGVLRECEVKLLAYLIGDGGLPGHSPRFTNSNPRIAEDFAEAVRAFGGVTLSLSSTRAHEAPSWRIVKDDDSVCASRAAFAAELRHALSQRGMTQRDLAMRVGVSAASVTHWVQGATVPDAPVRDRVRNVLGAAVRASMDDGSEGRRNAPSALTAWLDALGLMGKGSGHKFVPEAVFTLERSLLALFINRLFSTDGWATVLSSGQSQLGYSSVSERLARQVQHLLLRFGVIASLRHRWVKYREARRSSWQLDITDAMSIATFIEEVGIFGKEDALARVSRSLESRRYQTNRDVIPRGAWAMIDERRGDLSWAEVARRSGVSGHLHTGTRALSRSRLSAIAAGLNDDLLRDLASSDVYWDRIVSIEPLGMRRVYDLTVPRTHNFIADDVCVHNTALALNLAEQIAFGGRTPWDHAPNARPAPVAFFSLEMTKSAVTQRLLSAYSGIGGERFRDGDHLGQEAWERIIRACDTLASAPVYIDDTAGLTVMQLRSRARRLAAKHGIKAIMIDYLQLLSAPAAARESRQVEVSTISRQLKALARELDVPIICLSQLNRATEQREGNRPRLSDLRESGSLEQDADVVMLLHREEYYHINDPSWAEENPDKVGLAELIVAKQRNGPTGIVKLAWDSGTTRFKNYAHDLGGGGYVAPARAAAPASASAGPRAAPATGGYDAPSQAFESKPRGAFAPRPASGPAPHHRDGGGPEHGFDEDDTGGAPF